MPPGDLNSKINGPEFLLKKNSSLSDTVLMQSHIADALNFLKGSSVSKMLAAQTSGFKCGS